MDNRRFILLARLDDPLETDGMVFRHIGSHNQDRIGVLKVMRGSGSAATSKGGTQTGYRGAVSYSGLIADATHSKPASEQLADQIVFFNVQRGSAKMTYAESMHHRIAVNFFDKRALA